MASKRRLRRRACTQKMKHETRRSAQGHADRLPGPPGTYAPYRCDFCGGWHVGRPRRKGRRHRRR